MTKLQEITEEEFINKCYWKALGKLWFQMRKLILPMAMRIMEEDLGKFSIKEAMERKAK